MGESPNVTNIKTEQTDWTLKDRLEISSEMQAKSVKQENDCLVQSKLDIKTEPQKDDSDFPIMVGISYNTCSYDIKLETEELFIKSECEDLVDELMQDPLDISSEMKGTQYKLCPIDDGKTDEPMIKFEYEAQFNEIMQDPLDVGSHIKVEISTSYPVDETSKIPVETRKENDLLTVDDEGLHGKAISNNQDHLFGPNKDFRKNKKYICHVCNKTFGQKGNLNIHLLIHSGIKSYSCEICKKSFTQKGSLNTHMLIHSSEKTHFCNVCKKVFSRKSILNDHKLIHSGVKPFSCQECEKSFTHKHHLIAHERLHTGDKPYSCDLCNKGFTIKSNLVRHRILHTKEKPFSCDICNKSFERITTLNKHRKIHKN